MTTHIDKADTSTAPELDAASRSAIRNLMQDAQESEQPRSAQATMAMSQEPAVKPRRMGRGTFPDLSAPETAQCKSRKPLALNLPKKRPSLRAVVLSLLVLTVILQPWLVLGVVVGTIFVTLGVFFALGYDSFWQRAMAFGRRYAGRRPARAVRLHARLDAFAMKWDAVLDRFPEGTVDGLYLPDFGEMAAADMRHDEALARRFDRLRETEV